ncbi:MAG: glycoside hydrolase family 97 protein [Flaviaesturariibacter sp.]|nr:glycoside hydrolase family 97 protein [Flaviaesturariibacter sp.]
MKRPFLCLLLALSVAVTKAQTITASSPNGAIRLTTELTSNGELSYIVTYKNRSVILPSALYLQFKEPAVALANFTLVKADSSRYDQTWKPVWGEYSSIRDQHRELKLQLKDRSGSNILVNVIFRVFNEGVGFRYEFPMQKDLNHFIVSNEGSQFHLAGDHTAFWLPGDYNSNEFTYNHTRLSEVNAEVSKSFSSISSKTFFDSNAVQTPLMLKSDDGLYINIHEAALLNYPAMNLVLDKTTNTLQSHLVPDAVGNKAYLQTPAKTPWRTIIVSDDAREIIAANRMILNLNEPSKIENTSWIKPQKFVGVWWEMHVDKSRWDYGNFNAEGKLIPHGKHGANTANVKRFIDFAAKNGIQGVLVEGWNVGWEDWFGKWKENVFDFVTPYPDYDVKELQRYAKSKGVKIIMHHETSGSVTNYERQMDTAYRFMKNHGMDAVKTGYVGYIIPRGEHHDGQWMVNHYTRAAEKMAGYKIMGDMHESVRLTGLHRTYPNWMASEAARGNEFNAWSEGNPPSHETILPFTRLMGGPMDYTPGIFHIKMSHYDPKKTNQVHTTLAKQLALYVTMYSPIQMAADLPENYEAKKDAFQFIKDVAVDWDDTKVLAAEPGEFLTIARKAKGSPNWFIGSISGNSEAVSTLRGKLLSFLPRGKTYVAAIYRDATNAHWKFNPMAYVVDRFLVDDTTNLEIGIAPGGGAAISLMPATANDLKTIRKYK